LVYKPGAKLTAGSSTIPVGGSVTLSCSVEPSAGWKYKWFRRTSDSSFVEFSRNNEENREITVTQGGIYKCDGKRGNPSFYSHSSLENIIEIMCFVTRQPNGSHVFSGESITLTCEVQGGETTEWTCEWRRSGSIIQWTDSKDWTFNVSESSSGNYMCQCRSRDDWYSSTHDTVSLTVTAQPKATLTAGPTTIPVGGSVTLSCSLPSAGWKYKWYIRTKNTPEVQLTDEENRDINVAQAGIYRCLGMRPNENYQSLVSDEVISNEVVVTRQPNRPQMFSGESITLTCEVQGGETTEWTCEWRRDGKTVKVGNDKHLTVSVNESSSEEYRCQCRRRDDWYSETKWNAVLTIDPNWSTFHSGDRVTFICDINEGKDTDWEYEIKKNGEQFLRSNPYKSFTFLPIQIDHSGEYQCCGLRKSSGDTKCSDTVSLTVTGESKWIFNLTALGS
uniref:Ig-like domain-containing protein n=1 Tax=Xiphophorus maculatus TaxID=8083 RepID=A0A3B5R6Z0_XIPMA